MVLNLLEQEGIQGRVDGEYLPGGVGELQAIDLVRVMVDESDYERARQVIREWEAIQVEKEESATHKSTGILPVFISGLVIGGGLVFWAYNTPVTEDGMDLNRDGVLDEKRIYRDHRISMIEVDRNFDGKADVVYHFDRRGVVKEAEHDDNFDGIYETKYRYIYGQPHVQESDLDQDENIDYRALFKYGILDEAVILGEGRDLRKKRKKFRMGKLVSAEYDSDGNGSYDIEYEYGHFEEVEKQSSIIPRQNPDIP